MRNKFDEQLHQLNNEMILMGSMIQNAIQETVSAFFNQDVEKAKRYGMNDHISKPLDVNRMFAVLKNFH